MAPHSLRFDSMLLLVAALLLVGVVDPAGAQTTVTNTNDTGVGSLRAALDDAAADATIGFDLGVVEDPSIDVLDVLGPLVVDEDGVSIDGTGAPGLTLTGSDDATTHFRLEGGGELTVIDVDQSQGRVELDGTLTYQTANDTRLDVTIVDLDTGNLQVGRLVKTGPGSLILLRSNSYSDGTTVMEGNLQGDADALQGDIVNGATLTFDESSIDGVFSGVISDLDPLDPLEPVVPGAVVKLGAGTLRIETNAQTFTGGTTISDGVLEIGSTSSLASEGDVTIEGPGTLRIELAPGGTLFTGDVGGSGTLSIEGPGDTLELEAGAFTGTLDFAGNALFVEDSGNVIQGDVEFNATGGTLRILSDATLDGAISGTGTVVVDPGAGGSVTLRGSNSHDATTVVSGTLVGGPGSLVGAIANEGLVRIDPLQDGTVTGTISGAGGVTKIGSTTATFGVDQTYQGATAVDAGELRLEADLDTASIAVASGATLSGFGNADLAALDVTGTLAPSLPGDALRFASATFQPGSVLVLDFRDDGTSDRVETLGDMDVTGSIAMLVIEPGEYRAGVTATILQAGGALSGVPTLDLADQAFLVGTATAVANRIDVEVTGGLVGLVDFAATPNQRSVANRLQAEFDALDADPMPGSPLDEVADNFVILQTGEVGVAYDDIGGESISAFAGAHLATAQHFERRLHRRAGAKRFGRSALLGFAPSPAANAGLRWPGGAVGFAVAAPEPTPGEDDAASLWADGWGATGRISGDGNAARVSSRLAGAAIGVDAPIGRHGRIGIAGGYGHADVDLSRRKSRSDSHSAHGALYTGWRGPLGRFSANGRLSWARNESERDIVFGGYSQTAEADFDTTGFGAGAELGLNLLQLGPLLFEPVGSLDWNQLSQESFRENRAPGLNLEVEAETLHSLRSGLGLIVNAELAIGEDAGFTPELRARWIHEFGDTDRTVESRFVGSLTPGTIRVVGAEAPRDALLAGAGWVGSLGSSLRVRADYDAVIDRDRLDHFVTVSVQLLF